MSEILKYWSMLKSMCVFNVLGVISQKNYCWIDSASWNQYYLRIKVLFGEVMSVRDQRGLSGLLGGKEMSSKGKEEGRPWELCLPVPRAASVALGRLWAEEWPKEEVFVNKVSLIVECRPVCHHQCQRVRRLGNGSSSPAGPVRNRGRTWEESSRGREHWLKGHVGSKGFLQDTPTSRPGEGRAVGVENRGQTAVHQ